MKKREMREKRRGEKELKMAEARRERNRKKSGVLLTLTLVLLAVTLLAFSGLLVKHRQSEILTVRSSFDRVVNLEGSIQKSITDLVSAHLNLTISIDGSNVTISEELPADLSGFETKFASFEAFVESNFALARIDADIDELFINLTPAGIVYSHTNGAEKVLIEKVNLAKSYDIKITFPPSASWTCQIIWDDYASGSTRVKIIAVDNKTSCQSERTVDTSQNSMVTIPHAQGDAKVKIDDNEIEIFRNNNNPYNSSVTIEPFPGAGITDIELPEITTNISFTEFEIIGKAKFLTY